MLVTTKERAEEIWIEAIRLEEVAIAATAARSTADAVAAKARRNENAAWDAFHNACIKSETAKRNLENKS